MRTLRLSRVLHHEIAGATLYTKRQAKEIANIINDELIVEDSLDGGCEAVAETDESRWWTVKILDQKGEKVGYFASSSFRS